VGAAAESEAAFVARCAAWMERRLGTDSAWRCWVAEREQDILGQLWLQLVEKLPNPVSEPERHAYVTNVYVREAERGRGLGGRLLETAIEWSRGRSVDSILLWPSEGSRSLYTRFGFRDSGLLWEAKLR